MHGTDELPIHPRTGLRAIGIGRRGPIWPIMGGSEDHGADGADGEQDQNNQDDQDQNGGAGNAGGKGPKRDPLYADLPDDHPLVKRHEALKLENKNLKPKAKIVDDAEAAKRTDAQKIADLQSKLDAQPAEVAAALRTHLVALHEIDQKVADLYLTGTTPELLLQQVAGLSELGGAGTKRKNHVPREGTKVSGAKPDETRDFIRAFTGADQ